MRERFVMLRHNPFENRASFEQLSHEPTLVYQEFCVRKKQAKN